MNERSASTTPCRRSSRTRPWDCIARLSNVSMREAARGPACAPRSKLPEAERAQNVPKLLWLEDIRQREFDASPCGVSASIDQREKRWRQEKAPRRAEVSRRRRQIAPEGRRPRRPRQQHESDGRAIACFEQRSRLFRFESRAAGAKAQHAEQRHRDQIEERTQAGCRSAGGGRACPPQPQLLVAALALDGVQPA